ncbi:MAG: hypothetical protein ABI282_11245 [Candidatus Baltobacteraceae bacterium]
MNEPTTKDILDALLGFREAAELRFTHIDHRFDAVDARFDGIDRRLDGIDRRLAVHDGRLDRIEGRLDGHDRRFFSLETTMAAGFNGIAERLGRLEEQRT